jgi:hypothetical protein
MNRNYSDNVGLSYSCAYKHHADCEQEWATDERRETLATCTCKCHKGKYSNLNNAQRILITSAYGGWSDSFPSYGTFKRKLTTRKSSPLYQKEIEEWAYRVNKLLSDRRIETYSALAHLLGTGFGSVHDWAVGKYPPSRKFRRAIENLEIQYLKNSLSLWQRIKASLRGVKG